MTKNKWFRLIVMLFFDQQNYRIWANLMWFKLNFNVGKTTKP